MHSMAEWYMRGEQYDQAKLSRILDVAQDLKVCLHSHTKCTSVCLLLLFFKIVHSKIIKLKIHVVLMII